MISLDDASLTMLLQLARPIPVRDRKSFLRDVAAQLRGEAEVGPGSVARVARDVQRRYLGNGTTSAAVAEGIKFFEEQAEKKKRRRKLRAIKGSDEQKKRLK